MVCAVLKLVTHHWHGHDVIRLSVATALRTLNFTTATKHTTNEQDEKRKINGPPINVPPGIFIRKYLWLMICKYVQFAASLCSRSRS